MIRAVFLSDLHLTTLADQRGQCFLELLKSWGGPRRLQVSATSTITHLFLVGDIFDLWLSRHGFFISTYAPLIEELRRLGDEGVEIHYFEGNHDLYLADFWARDLKVRVHAGPFHMVLGKWRLRIEHGDQMDPDDRGYIFLRWLLRTPLVTWLARHLPSAIVVWLGRRASQTSRTYTSQIKTASEADLINKIRRHAERVAEGEVFDLLISGHVHVRDDFQFISGGSRTVRSINLGSWLGREYPLLILETSALSLIDVRQTRANGAP